MEYAIIESGGKQYKVMPGMKLDLDNLGLTEGEFEFKNVLFSVSGEDVSIGMPYIAGMTVKAKVLGAAKGDKVRVSKFKAKSRYRKTIGFRASLTTVEILPFSEKGQKKK
ncbi:MAG: 50S ribosomal protein L21 [Candidatus Levybacteria bacterium]|nr:50S ribosomal protein L21 [Candidatus Levybacteria bacterium]MBP9815578.1 50S ribosomal protein L21 [Candidatus Levybacteria bacterium]